MARRESRSRLLSGAETGVAVNTALRMGVLWQAVEDMNARIEQLERELNLALGQNESLRTRVEELRNLSIDDGK